LPVSSRSEHNPKVLLVSQIRDDSFDVLEEVFQMIIWNPSICYHECVKSGTFVLLILNTFSNQDYPQFQCNLLFQAIEDWKQAQHGFRKTTNISSKDTKLNLNKL